jgi:hypothetical protein
MKLLTPLNYLLPALLFSHAVAAYQRYQCNEYWYAGSIEQSQSQPAQHVESYPNACREYATHADQTGSYYHRIQQRIYWVFDTVEHSKRCVGMPGTAPDLLNPFCYLPEKWQKQLNDQQRSYFLVSEDADHFRLLMPPTPTMPDWQQDQLQRYARDTHNVYLNSEKIADADVESFHVTFPLGQAASAEFFSFAADKQHQYLDGKILNIPIEKVKWVTPSCVAKGCHCDDYQLHHTLVGTLENDLVVFNYAEPGVRLKGVGRGDVHYQESVEGVFLRIDNKLYRLNHGISGNDIAIKGLTPTTERQLKSVVCDLETRLSLPLE